MLRVDRGARREEIDFQDTSLDGLGRNEYKRPFARAEALGAGDYDIAADDRLWAGGLIDSYNVSMPEWSPAFLAKVVGNLSTRPEREALLAKLGAETFTEEVSAQRVEEISRRLTDLLNSSNTP